MKYLLIISLFVITSFVLANDGIEIIDEGDGGSSGESSGPKKPKLREDFENDYGKYAANVNEFKW